MEGRRGVQRGWWIRVVVASALAMLALALLPRPAAAILSDAACPGPPDAAPKAVLGDRREAQTFTAIHTGALQRATIEIDNLHPANPDFLVEVLPTDSGGAPVNGALASATVPSASVPAGVSTLDVTFSPGANVVAGQHYALAISRPGANFLIASWNLQTRNPDACEGASFFSSGAAAGWGPESANVDFIFQTFVNPANIFTIVGKRGRLYARVPGPGTVDIRRSKFLRKFHATAHAAGDVQLKLKLTKRAIVKILSGHLRSLPIRITFSPTGGDPNTLKFKIKIRTQ